jgi:carbonic anhydrase
MTSNHGHSGLCACCRDLMRGMYDRRRFLQAAGAGAALALTPSFALAAKGHYEAMVLACIDPRVQEPVRNYMARRKLTGKYSQFVFAGAAIGVVAPAFKEWHKTFWDNLGASVELHNIKRVIVLDHRDCGAAKMAYGDAKVATRDAETETHRRSLAEFRKQCNERHAKLAVETGLMSLDGKIQTFS